jgi:hypothetical protein
MKRPAAITIQMKNFSYFTLGKAWSGLHALAVPTLSN